MLIAFYLHASQPLGFNRVGGVLIVLLSVFFYNSVRLRGTMKFKINQKITWSHTELGGLLEDDDCCVHFERTKKHLALHPFHLKNLCRAINEILMSKLNSYDKELKGFLISYKNPKLLSNLGGVFYDSYFIHVDIVADFYLFRPKVECSLKGIVNKKGLDYIVLLIHKVFTVTIPKPDIEQKWSGHTVEIGQEVKCYVTQIDKSTKPPSIYAVFKSDYLQGCKLPEICNSTNYTDVDVKDNIYIKNNISNTTEVTNGIISASDNEDISIKKKIRKIKVEAPDSEED